MRYAVLALGLLCTACGEADVKGTLGLNRAAPDEFRVVSRPPLSVPREFTLYPPDEARGRAARATTPDARSLVFGGSAEEKYTTQASLSDGSADTAVAPVGASPLPSGAEEQLLQRLGAQRASADIRETLRQERAVEDADPSLLDQIREPYKQGEPVVDAAAESKRLKQNAAEGKSVTEGDVPTQTPSTSILDEWF